MSQFDWNNTKDSFRESLPAAQFQNWLQPIELVRNDSSTVVLGVPNSFHAEWVKNHYADRILEAIRAKIGADTIVEFEVLAQQTGVVEESKEVALVPQRTTALVDNSIPEEDAPLPARRSDHANLPLFTTPYMEFEFNKMPSQCARLFAQGQSPQFNPLIILGGVGMGKTHLLWQIGKTMYASSPQTKIRYTTSETFTTEMVQSFRENSILSFKRKYREETECLLFDDIQGLTRRMRTQEELLYIFNDLVAYGGRVAFTSNTLPNRLDDFIEPLKSRLLSSVIAEIKQPSFEERVALLRQKTIESHLRVDETVLRILAAKVQKDVRELIGTLFRLHLQAQLEGRDLDTDFLSQHGFSTVESDETPREDITIQEILGLVESNFGVKHSDLMSKSRKSNVAWARQVAMYLARIYTGLPLEQIGKLCGRDHATVMYAYDKVKEIIEEHAQRRYEVEFLLKKLNARRPPPKESDPCTGLYLPAIS